jgi:drug/metabolite transporter (DMT)-like permease
MPVLLQSPPVQLSLLAAFLYAAGALVIKRSAELGVGVWRTAFVANLVCALLFLPLLALGGEIHAGLWWQPVLTGTCFVAGQWLTFIAFERGDVSVATPVLGIKILLVAVLVTAIGGQSLPPRIWAAAGLATLGIALLNRRPAAGVPHDIGRTVLTAGAAATVFAVFDVLVQLWSPRWGTGRFLPLTLGAAALLSFALVPRFRAPLSAINRPAWPWLAGGALLIGLQSVIFVSTIARWGQVAVSNVAYSSRGLWSIVLVWLASRWLGGRERVEGRLLAWRLAGATLMISAVALVAA